MWICPYPNGHIQAVGTDAAGRRQYLYHQKWQDERNEEKFDRVLEMSARCPTCDAASPPTLPPRPQRDRVLALALHLLDLGYFRAGTSSTPRRTILWLATLLCEHVALHKEAVEFDYPAKSGVDARCDPRSGGGPGRAGAAASAAAPSDSWCAVTAPVDRPSRRRPQRALQRTRRRRVHRQGPAHLARHRAGGRGLRRYGPSGEQDRDQTRESAVMKEVAEELGNTPAVARCPMSIRGWSRVTSPA